MIMEDSLTLQESFVDSLNSSEDSVHHKIKRHDSVTNENKDLDHQIEKMIERNEEGRWKCKVCGKIAKRTQTKRHAETHIEGLSYSCPMCSKSCSTKQY